MLKHQHLLVCSIEEEEEIINGPSKPIATKANSTLYSIAESILCDLENASKSAKMQAVQDGRILILSKRTNYQQGKYAAIAKGKI